MEKIEITQDNFYLGTKCRFKGCKRPNRQADFISSDRRTGQASSEYWYGQDKIGKYVIRSSNHWSNSNNTEVFSCKKIKSCYWWLITNCKSNHINEGSSRISYSGKAYFVNFEKNK